MVEGETWVEDLLGISTPRLCFSAQLVCAGRKLLLSATTRTGETQGGVSSGPEYPQVLITILHPQPSDLSPAKLRGSRWGGSEAEERAMK